MNYEDLCKEKFFDYGVFKDRYTRGWDIDMIFSTSYLRSCAEDSVVVDYGNIKFKSLLEMSNALKYNYKKVLARYNLGWSLKDLVETPTGTLQIQFFNYKRIKSTDSFLKEQGIFARDLSKVLSRNVPLSSALERARDIGKGVLEFRGRTYVSFAELTKEFNLAYNLARSRYTAGWSLEDIVERGDVRIEEGGNKGASKPIFFKGKLYRTHRELAEELDISACMLSARIAQGLSDEEIAKPIKCRNNGIKVSYNGEDFRSLLALAESQGLVYTNLRYLIKVKNLSVDEAVAQAKKLS